MEPVIIPETEPKRRWFTSLWQDVRYFRIVNYLNALNDAGVDPLCIQVVMQEGCHNYVEIFYYHTKEVSP